MAAQVPARMGCSGHCGMRSGIRGVAQAKRTAVIGAGVAGLACARVLRRAGCYVEMFEQDRIIGGRMATTRLGLTPFDHGAQYITARSPAFKTYLDELVAAGTEGLPATGKEMKLAGGAADDASDHGGSPEWLSRYQNRNNARAVPEWNRYRFCNTHSS